MICGYKFNIRHIIKHLFCNALKPYVVVLVDLMSRGQYFIYSQTWSCSYLTKQLPVLIVHFFLVLSLNISYEFNFL